MRCISFFPFFFFGEKKSLCVETCHIENVVRTKAKKKNCLYFWEHFSFLKVGGGGRESKLYDNSLILIVIF